MNRGRISPVPLSVMTTFVKQLFLPFAVCSVSPLRVAVLRAVPLPPAWLVPVRAKRLSFPQYDGVASRKSRYIRFGCLPIGRAYVFGKIKQRGGDGVATKCVLEVGYREVPADNGFLLGGKVLDDAHFVLVRKVVIEPLSSMPTSLKCFFSE